MRQTRMIRPEYAARFSCIGPRCEDTCCAGWSISIDEPSYRKYTNLPDVPLRALIVSSMQLNATSQSNARDFATMRMEPSGTCPLLSKDRLCSIQVEYGASYLCQTCALFPRTRQVIDGLEETGLSLSCPEAARLVLLDPQLLPPAEAPGYRMSWDETGSAEAHLRFFFWPIRELVLGLLRNRTYPLWQRMFLLGAFSRRLDASVRPGGTRGVPGLLDDFSRAVAAGGLRQRMESIPADLRLQLEIVLHLVAQRVRRIPLSPRLHAVLGMFLDGIGYSPKTSIDSSTERYRTAYTELFEPFFRHYPYILENYLLNAVLRDQFPFERKLADINAPVQPARAFTMLAVQFAVIKGLLIGVAGARQHRFCAEDVIQTVQTAFRHFEHDRQYLPDACTLLAAKGLDNARGLTMLLRN